MGSHKPTEQKNETRLIPRTSLNSREARIDTDNRNAQLLFYFSPFFVLRLFSLSGRTKTSSRNSDVNFNISEASSDVTSLRGST